MGAETLLKVYGVEVDPEEFAAFAGMGEVSARPLQDFINQQIGRHCCVQCAHKVTCVCRSFSFARLAKSSKHVSIFMDVSV